MKVEELYKQESQVGVTLRRVQYETEVDIFPQSSLSAEPGVKKGGDVVMSELTSEGELTEELLSRAVKHSRGDGSDEWAIPLKRNDSGAHQHCLQGCSSKTESNENVEQETEPASIHRQLLDEIDGACDSTELTDSWGQGKPAKKVSTLTRMFKGKKGEKDAKSDNASKDSPNNRSIGKIFQNMMHPVGKTSRDNISKVLHRIGDAIQKKKEEGRTDANRQLYRSKTSESDRSRQGVSTAVPGVEPAAAVSP